MYLVKAEEMRELDRYTVEEIGISSLVLMENAGREIANVVMEFSEAQGKKSRRKSWIILVGKGNNGGDGLVAARHMVEAGFNVTLLLMESETMGKSDALIQLGIVRKLGLPLLHYLNETIAWESFDGIIDGLLGTGSKGGPRENYAKVIREANTSGLPIIAIDIPSGLDADTGAVFEPCIHAVSTVTLAFLKIGLVQYPGAEFAGEVIVKSIGIPVEAAVEKGVHAFLLEDSVFKEQLGVDIRLPRRPDSNKGTYGHVLVVAGTRRMSGAGLLCSHAALRMGCGLVSWALPDRLLDPMIGRLPEIMLCGITDQALGEWTEQSSEALIKLADKKAAMVVGPGIGRFPGEGAWLRAIWEGTDCPLVIDADALNVIADAVDFASWRARAGAVILTPHPGEMARLLGIPVHEVQRDRIGVARRYAVQHGVTVVLKGTRTVCATPEGVVFVNTTGNPGMATAGAGDVLAGLIGSLLAQKLTAEQAACLGVYLHGAAGDRAAAKRHSAGSLIASDIIAEL